MVEATPLPQEAPPGTEAPTNPFAVSVDPTSTVVPQPPRGVAQATPHQVRMVAPDAAAAFSMLPSASAVPGSLETQSPTAEHPVLVDSSPEAPQPSSSPVPMSTVRVARALTAAGVPGAPVVTTAAGAVLTAAGAAAAATVPSVCTGMPAAPAAIHRTPTSSSVPRPLPPPGRRALNPWPFGPYVTAPMVDASELPFRLLTRRHGVSLAYTPMFHAALFSTSAHYRAEHWTTCEADRPLAVQFCANDPATFVAAGRYVDGGEVDFIDLNLGCPQGIARKGRYGAFLQDDWVAIEALVSTAARELKTPISAKIRIFPDTAKTVAYARMIEAAGASVLAVHGRTREQKGRTAGPADWEVIRAVKAALSIPVLANGNVNHRGDADTCLAATGADAVLSAVWLLENPALFEAPDAPTAALSDRMALAEEYLRLCEDHPVPMRCVRAHLFKLMRSRLNTCMEENGSLGKAKTLEEFWGVLRVLRGKCDDGEPFEVCQQRLRLEAAAVAATEVATDGEVGATSAVLAGRTAAALIGESTAAATGDSVAAPTVGSVSGPTRAMPLPESRLHAAAPPVLGQKRPWEAQTAAGASSTVDG